MVYNSLIPASVKMSWRSLTCSDFGSSSLAGHIARSVSTRTKDAWRIVHKRFCFFCLALDLLFCKRSPDKLFHWPTPKNLLRNLCCYPICDWKSGLLRSVKSCVEYLAYIGLDGICLFLGTGFKLAWKSARQHWFQQIATILLVMPLKTHPNEIQYAHQKLLCVWHRSQPTGRVCRF